MVTLKLDSGKYRVLVKNTKGDSVVVDYMAPKVNINGSSAGALMNNEMDILRQVELLSSTIRVAAPHGRDFQISPEGDYDKARALFMEDLFLLNQIRARHEAMLLDIQKQDR